MKDFFKTTFACVLGVLIALGVMMFLSLFVLIGMASLSEPSYMVKPNTILHLKLQGELLERSKENPFRMFLSDYEVPTTGLDEILTAIDVAKADKNIIGIFLESNTLSAGTASLNEIRNKLEDFKSSGKFITAYADNYQQDQYYLATVADQVFMNPSGILNLHGLASTHIFFKNALDKLGIEMQVFRVGTFKSAVEPFIATQMSEANRKQTEVYLNSIWNNLITAISQSRQLTPEQINEYADRDMAFEKPEESVSLNLVDGLMYRSQVEALLMSYAGVTRTKDLNLASVANIASLKKKQPNAKQKIAVVYAVGEIDGMNPSEGINSRKLVKNLNDIQADSTVKAVVLRVNSPGGSAFGSEQIWKAVEDLKQVKPVAVSMGDYAASGGYYISCNANRIFADPTTLTGSIGIFGMIPDASDLLNKKIGLTFDEVRTNRYGNFPTIIQPMNEDEKAMLQAYVERGYGLFTKRCAEGRNMPLDSILHIAGGRVWTGSNALEIGLVDELGDLNTAINWIAGTADLSKYEIMEYPRKKTFYEELLSQMGGSISLRMAQSILGQDFETYQILKYIRNFDPLQARTENIRIR